MRTTLRIISRALPIALLAVPSVAGAQKGDAKVTQFVPDGDVKAAEEGEGWDGTLGVAANIAIAQNSSVVGQLDGTSFLIGFALSATLKYKNGPHELANTLNLIESFAQTPALEPLIKTNDAIRLETMYGYYFLPWAGAFGRLSFEAPVFATSDERGKQTTFTVARLSGMTDTVTSESLSVSESFQPLTLTQSIGLVARPIETEPFAVNVRLGGGGRETLASGVFVKSDDAATADIIEYTEVDDVVQAGLELAIGVAGKFPTERLTYGVDASLLFPFVNNDAAERSAVDLTRIGLSGAVNFSMFEWLSLVYQLRVLSDPQLVDAVQVQNNLLLSFQYDIIAAPKVEPAPAAVDPALQKALDEAKLNAERAQIAEDRLKVAEDRAKLAEERAKAAEEKAGQPAPEPQPEGQP